MKKVFFLFLLPLHIFSQTQTVGLFQNEASSFEGYTLFSPNHNTYLIDNCWILIHSWTSLYKPGSYVYLLEDGSLLRPCRIQSSIFTGGGSGGRIEKYAWDNTLLWSYNFSDSIYHQHHDIHPMDNGNILVLCWERLTSIEAIDLGRDPNYLIDNELWTSYILEVEPIGFDSINIVWEWHLKDHLIQDFDSTKNNFGIVKDNPQLIDINFFSGLGKKDWMHCNSISYNPVLDEILISSRSMSEIYIIDHSTTTQQASSNIGGNHNKGGDIIFRWGNPEVYNRGLSNDKKFFGQHDASWIPEGFIDGGKIMVFNNGQSRGYSSIDIINPLKDVSGNYLYNNDSIFMPSSLDWTYIDSIPQNFYSSYISGSQRLENGNTLICDGAYGRFFEIDSQKNIVWDYINPVLSNSILSQGDPIPNSQNGTTNSVFRCTRFAYDYSAFNNRNLIPGSPIELNSISFNCQLSNSIISDVLNDKKLIGVFDILGRQIEQNSTGILLYLFSDGSVEKKMRIQ